jgi:hypothetical protein
MRDTLSFDTKQSLFDSHIAPLGVSKETYTIETLRIYEQGMTTQNHES